MVVVGVEVFIPIFHQMFINLLVQLQINLISKILKFIYVFLCFNYFSRDTSDGATQPPMLSFKNFLHDQDDNIDQEEAVKRYTEYKINFKKTQIAEFFAAHKDEDWFVKMFFFFIFLLFKIRSYFILMDLHYYYYSSSSSENHLFVYYIQ
jgi:hypothetical protein